MGSQGESSWDPAVDLLVGAVNWSKSIFAVAEVVSFLYKEAMLKLCVFILISLSSVFSLAAKIPACMDRTERLDFNENKVLVWRDLTDNKFVGRALVRGLIVQVLEDRQKHVHFEVDFDGNFSTTDDRIEVVYSTKFGPVPENRRGDELIACGDFVKDSYSPLKAVIHWLHKNPDKNGVKAHDHGFLIINGILAGQN